MLVSASATARAEAGGEDGPVAASEATATATTVSTVLPPELAPIVPRLGLFAAGARRGAAAEVGLFAPAPHDIRLSRGAKTAIIVTAIVVGALLVIGVVVVASKPKHIVP